PPRQYAETPMYGGDICAPIRTILASPWSRRPRASQAVRRDASGITSHLDKSIEKSPAPLVRLIYNARKRLKSTERMMHMTQLQYRQGDLLFILQEERPAVELTMRPSQVIVAGEATGHAHRLTGGSILET